MRKFIRIIEIVFIILIASLTTNAQCNWKTKLYDGFEYSTVVPYLVAGTTIHNTPQSFAVHSGSKSLYMNFVNTMPANTMVYERPFNVCLNVPVRFSAYITTSFSGVQCNVRFEIVDSNNVVLDSISMPAQYAPVWSHYVSANIAPSTSLIKLRIYSVTAGTPGGNDLSLDDLTYEQCSGLNLGVNQTICNNQTILLDAGNFASYLWGTGDTTSTYLAAAQFPGNSATDFYVSCTDTNGCVFQDTIRISFITCSGTAEFNKESFTVFPVPATEYIYIKTEAIIEKIQLTDLSGKSIVCVKSNTVDVRNIPPGVYFLRVTDANSRVVVQIVTIQR